MACKVIDLHSFVRQAKETALGSKGVNAFSHHFSACRFPGKTSQARESEETWERILEKQLAQCKAEIVIQSNLSHVGEADPR